MRIEASVDVAAPAQVVFDTYVDVELWPSWTGSVTGVEPLDRGPLRVGARTRVRQPRLPVAIWQVTALEPGREFTWQTRGAGVLTTATHRVTPITDIRCRVTAILRQAGPLAAVVGLTHRWLTRRYLDTELRGLKAYCEA